MKSNTIKYLAIAAGIIALLISINAIYRKSYFIGVGGLVVCSILIYLSIKVEPKEVKISFPEVVKKYKEYMETYFRITLPKDTKVYHLEEFDKIYLAVLCYEDAEEAKHYYFPFEADKFTGEFGRGAGQVFDDTEIGELEFWINKYDKTYRAEGEIANRMGQQIAKKIREEMEFYNRAKGGEDEEATKTSGGTE